MIRPTYSDNETNPLAENPYAKVEFYIIYNAVSKWPLKFRKVSGRPRSLKISINELGTPMIYTRRQENILISAPFQKMVIVREVYSKL